HLAHSVLLDEKIVSAGSIHLVLTGPNIRGTIPRSLWGIKISLKDEDQTRLNGVLSRSSKYFGIADTSKTLLSE
ncbi:MAG: hypothetical protein ABW158_18415, partial [Candidatus Thiodiazotropha sp. 6PDIVS]